LAFALAAAFSLFVSAAARAEDAKPESESEIAERMTAAAKALVAALPADLVKANTFEYAGPEHKYWHWVPVPLIGDKALGADRTFAPYGRFGVPVEKMDVKAIALLHDLLKTGLSGEGYRKVQLIIRQEGPAEPRQAFIGLGRSATSKPAGGPDWYHFTLFGEVGSKKWGWRFEGHHVSLTYEIEDGKIRFSPGMIGFNPSPLPPRAAEAAMLFYRELPAETREAAHIVKAAKDKAIPADCTRTVAPPAPVGAKLTGLSDDAKWYLFQVLEEYIGNYPDALARPLRKELHKQIGEMHFAWWGPLDHAQEHFYRLQGPTFLIEMRHQGGGSTKAHIHGVWRNLTDGSVNSPAPVAAK
jgi:hypothetical protein